MGAEQSSSRSSRSRSHEDLVQDILDQQRAAFEEKVRQTLLSQQRAAAISNAHEAVESHEDLVQDILDQQRAAFEEKVRQTLLSQQRAAAISNAHEAVERPAATQNTPSQLFPNLRSSENVIQPTISKASFFDSPNTSNVQRNTNPFINRPSVPTRSAASPSAPPPSAPVASTSRSSNANAPSTSKYSPAATQNTPSQLYPNLRSSENVIQRTISKASFYDSPNTSNVQRNTDPLINQPSTPTRSVASPSAPPPSAPDASTSSSSNANATTTSKYSYRRTNDENNPWKCITCNNVLSVKIFQCGQGHSSCMVCKFKGLNCGVCRYPITDTRNIDLERYIEEVQLKTVNDPERAVDCPNKSDGCRLSFKQGNIDAHLKECPFREMACPVAFLYGGCFWRGKINHIKEHISECHPNQAGADVDTEMTLNFHVGNTTVHHVVMGNFHFLVNLKLDAEALYSTAQLIGSRVSASKWIYELHIYNKSEPRRKYTFNDTCIPNSDIFSDICKESKCAALPWPYVTSFVNNNALTYKFYIKKISKSETDDSRPRRRYGKTVHKNNRIHT